ncbi:hypothetical protein ACIGXG_31930 [Streptomyces goshikiensis]
MIPNAFSINAREVAVLTTDSYVIVAHAEPPQIVLTRVQLY